MLAWFASRIDAQESNYQRESLILANIEIDQKNRATTAWTQCRNPR